MTLLFSPHFLSLLFFLSSLFIFQVRVPISAPRIGANDSGDDWAEDEGAVAGDGALHGQNQFAGYPLCAVAAITLGRG